MKHKIIDNFLPQEDFLKIKNTIMGADFEWYFNPFVSNSNSNDGFYFTHNFFKDYLPRSNKINLLEHIIFKIKPRAIIRIKANFYPRTNKILEHDKHIDFHFENKGFIFYINNNDGYTRLNDGTIVESIENRGLFFDAHIEHNSSTCTNQFGRVNINFNYF